MVIAILFMDCLLQSAPRLELLPDALTLLRQAAVVGFVPVGVSSYDPSSTWRQHVFIDPFDLLKGTLERDPITNRFPVIWADPAIGVGYPAWFDRQSAEYLVFLQHNTIEGQTVWTTMASFGLIYEPDQAGRVVGFLEGSRSVRLTRDEIRARLLSMIKGAPETRKTDQSLTSLLHDVADTQSASEARKPIPHRIRLLEAQRLAAAVRMNTARKDIEKIFPQMDGGLERLGSTRYYVGSEVMVEVPFDQTGGAWNQENRVNGPLKVYRSRMHFD